MKIGDHYELNNFYPKVNEWINCFVVNNSVSSASDCILKVSKFIRSQQFILS